MSEQATQTPQTPQTPQVNPQEIRPGEAETYVTDPARAEALAYASKEQEEAYVEHSANAKYYGRRMEGTSDWRVGEFRNETDLAQQARKEADKLASSRADAYDRGVGLEITGLTPKQQQTAGDLMNRIKKTQVKEKWTDQDLRHTFDLEAMGKKVPFARFVGETGVHAVAQFRANRAVKATTKQYEQNAPAYQEQAQIDAANDGVEVKR